MNIKRLTKPLTDRLDAMLTTEQFSSNEIVRIFYPLVLDQLFIFVIGILSTAMVSSSGESAIAAVSLVGVFGQISYALFSAVSMGGAIVIARAKGGGDPERVREAIGQATVCCFLVGCLIAFVMYTYGGAMVARIYPDADPALIQYSIDYVKVFSLSMIPYSVYCVILNAFRSLGDAKSSLKMTIVINSAHLIGSFIYINLLDMSVVGSALSFLTARIAGFVFAVVWLLRPKSGIFMRFRHFIHMDKAILKDISVLGVPFSFEQVLFQGGMLLVQMYLAKLTTTELAAHSITSSIFNLYYAVAFALTTLTGTVCGQCVGAKRVDLARKYCKSIVSLGMFVLIGAVIVLYPLTPALLKLYAPSKEAVRIVYVALALGAFPMPLVWCEGNVIPSATRTAGDAAYTTVVSLIALAVGRMALGYVFTIQLGMGVPGVWVGQLVEWCIRACVMRARLEGNRWIKIPLH